MKKISIFVALVAVITLSSCGYDDSGINNRLDELDNRLEKLEGTTLPSIDEQIESINASIADLKVVDTELRQLIEALEADAEEHSELIATLQTKASELESKIATLEEYVDSEITATEDWATATFATLEQYAEVQSEISGLKALLEQNKSVITEAYTAAIAEAITTSEGSMKEWVNEQLAGYYTIAETDAKLEPLQRSIDTLSESLAEEVETLSERIETMKSELTEAYEAAITEAIETNNGVINSKIAEEINSVNSHIDEEVDAITERIDGLEDRIAALEDIVDKIQALDIEFDNTEGLICYEGASVEVGYTIMGGDDKTKIESFGDGGWRASIIKISATEGKIKVTAPTGATDGKVVVMATSGVGGVVMKTLYFEEGILANINDSYKVSWEACTLKVKLHTNLDYEVRIPAEAQSWLSVADTRAAMREETLSFTIAENPEDAPARSATVELINEFGETLQSFEIVQKALSSKPIPHAQFDVDIEIKNITSNSAEVTAKPNSTANHYYFRVISKMELDAFDIYNDDYQIFEYIIENPNSGDWITQGETTLNCRLAAETDYLAVAFNFENWENMYNQVDEIKLFRKAFTTPEGEPVDPNSLFITDNLTTTHTNFSLDVTPALGDDAQWTYYIWTKSSYEQTLATEAKANIVMRSYFGLNNIAVEQGYSFGDIIQTDKLGKKGSNTITAYEPLHNNTEYVVVLFYVDPTITDPTEVYDYNYVAVEFKTQEPSAGATASLEVSEPIIVKDGFSYSVNFVVKTNDNAVDLLAGAQLWNNYEFEKYWDPNDWSQIQAFFMFRKPVGEETLAAAKSAEGATISFTGFDKEDYVFFFEVLNAENTATQFAVRVTPEMFDNAE